MGQEPTTLKAIYNQFESPKVWAPSVRTFLFKKKMIKPYNPPYAYNSYCNKQSYPTWVLDPKSNKYFSLQASRYHPLNLIIRHNDMVHMISTLPPFKKPTLVWTNSIIYSFLWQNSQSTTPLMQPNISLKEKELQVLHGVLAFCRKVAKMAAILFGQRPAYFESSVQEVDSFSVLLHLWVGGYEIYSVFQWL